MYSLVSMSVMLHKYQSRLGALVQSLKSAFLLKGLVCLPASSKYTGLSPIVLISYNNRQGFLSPNARTGVPVSDCPPFRFSPGSLKPASYYRGESETGFKLPTAVSDYPLRIRTYMSSMRYSRMKFVSLRVRLTVLRVA